MKLFHERAIAALSYIEWLSLIAFITFVGVFAMPDSLYWAIGAWVFAAVMLVIMITLSSPTYSPNMRISGGTMLGYPLFDIFTGIALGYGMYEQSPVRLYLIFGMVAVIADFLLWLAKVFRRSN